ncbi:probable membrane-associated kinase regulator 3 [Salvia splendens]|uniref:probable membrane-associated kinase regulator 3 n=1 Tax=Salvia splendens TaxID=180675 RepID=UPI001C25BF79|nr:probable membrane-associated kinase regulator 3 [Salvia splendens]
MKTEENEYEEEEEDDYIDMELSSSSDSREFEFQMSGAATLTQTADHLFHKGRLLPLYLLPSTTANAAADISPSESRRASCDLSSDDFFFEWSSDLISHRHHPTKIPWPKKLKHSLKAYLKSLFIKYAKSQEINAKRNPTAIDDDTAQQRRSFSSAIKRHSPTKCLSSSSSNSSSAASSFSLNSNGLHDQLQRSSSATDTEASIEAAIAYCKKSQQIS